MNSAVPTPSDISADSPLPAHAKRQDGVHAMLISLARLDDATATIARILLGELGKYSLEFPLLQTRIVPASKLLQNDVVRRAAARTLNPEIYLRQKIDFLKKIRLETAPHTAGTAAPPSSPLLDIIEIREWLDPKRSQYPLAWMARPGQWTFWSLSARGRAVLGRAFEASLRLRCRVTAELVIELANFIGVGLLPQSQTGRIKIRLGTLMDIAAKSSTPDDTPDAARRTSYERCFDALRALERAGVVSQLTLPTPGSVQPHPDTLDYAGSCGGLSVALSRTA